MIPETDTLTHMLDTFLNAFKIGRGSVFGSAWSLLSILVSLEIVLAALFWALSGREVISQMLKKVLVIGFFIFVVQNWDGLISNVIDGFIYTGENAAVAAGGRKVSLENPSAIVDAGFQAVFPIFDHIRSKATWTGVLSHLPDILLTLIASLIIIGAYFILAIQVFVTRLEFGLIATLGLILVPFGVFRQTSFLTEKVFGAIISFGVKLMVLAFIISITFPVLAQYQVPNNPSWPELFSMMVVALAVMSLSWHAPGVAASLLSGSPSLTATGAMGSAVGAAALTGATGYGAKSVTSAGLAGGGKASSVLKNVSSTTSHAASYGLGMASASKNASGSTVTNFAKRSSNLVSEKARQIGSPLSSFRDSLKESFQNGKEVRITPRQTDMNNDFKIKDYKEPPKHNLKSKGKALYLAKSSIPKEEHPEGETRAPIKKEKSSE